MSWQLSRKGDRYRIWSTVSDQYITDWMSRNEALAVWYDDALMSFKKKVIEQYLLFPHHWGDQDSGRTTIIMDDERKEKLQQWLVQLSATQTAEDYETLVDEMYEMVAQELRAQ